ncbi:hypothetical protein B0H11DRAFT_1906237 [Mycena galericulata]|nr:hypothetical protein B0H11DRAFT_1906237 [Mycena galericulata]
MPSPIGIESDWDRGYPGGSRESMAMARFQPWSEARGYMLRHRPGWVLPLRDSPVSRDATDRIFLERKLHYKYFLLRRQMPRHRAVEVREGSGGPGLRLLLLRNGITGTGSGGGEWKWRMESFKKIAIRA